MTKKLRKMNIQGRLVGDEYPAYVIAEIGINHGGDKSRAFKLIDSAIKAGVDAVKFQTYITEKRTSSNSPIFGILKECELPFDDFKDLKEYSESKNVHFFSTPFDLESLSYLESIGCTHYKIASFYTNSPELVEAVGKTGKPVIYSTGMSPQKDIEHVSEILSAYTDNIGVLHCVSSYPTAEVDCNLSAISSLKSILTHVVGQSDHTPGIKVPVYAVAAGAKIIEKHFRIDENWECVDAPVSITEKQTKQMIEEIRQLEAILGSSALEVLEVEKPLLWLKNHP